MLTIRQIYQENYPDGKRVLFTYTSEKYYEIHTEANHNGWNFSLIEKSFEMPFEKKCEVEIFDSPNNDLEVYVSEMNGKECGVIVMQYIQWNNTLQINDLYVDFQFKRKSIGSALFEIAKKRAHELGTRMITLETQTSNYPAIQFYLKKGFQLIGFHLNSYSNEDIKKKEVRLEMGYYIET